MSTSALTKKFSAAVERAFSQPITDRKDFNQYSRKFSAEYETAFQILTSVKSADALVELMDAYLSLYDKYAVNTDNVHYYRSDQLFVGLLEQSKKVKSPTRNLVADWVAELTGSGSSRLKKRAADLNDHYKADVRKLIEDQRRSGSLLTLLRNEYARQTHVAAPTDAQLRAFNPVPGEAFKRDLEKVLSNTTDAWNVCVAKNEDPQRNAFHVILDLYRAYLSALAKQDVMKVFQAVKYFQDRLTTTYERKGDMVVVNKGTRDVLVCEMYTMACLQLLVYGQGLRLQGNRLRFTAEEQAYFLKSLRDPDYEYFSNIERRFDAQMKSVDAAFDASKTFLDLILLTKDQISRATLVNLKKTLDVQDTWQQIEVVTEKLKKAGRDKAALTSLVSDAKMRRQLETLHYHMAVEIHAGNQDIGRRVLHVGTSPGSHATFGVITIVQIDPKNPNDIYVEYQSLRPNLFLVHKDYLDDKVLGAALVEMHRSTIGMVYVVEGLFTALGFLPAFIEGGFVAVIYEVIIYFGSNKLGEWAAEINPLFGQLVALAAGMVVPRPNFKGGLKVGELEEPLPPSGALTQNAALIENRATKEASGSPGTEAKLSGEGNRGAVAAEAEGAAPPKPKVRQEPLTKVVSANDNRIQTFDDVVAEIAKLEEAEGLVAAEEEAEFVAANDEVAARQGRVEMASRKVAGSRASGTRGRVSGSQGGPGRRGGGGPRGTANKGVLRKIELKAAVKLKLGKFAEHVVRAAEIYREKMAALAKKIRNPALRSTIAHNETLKEMVKAFPETVRGKQRTGVMTVDEAGKPRVRESDVAFHDPEAKVDKNYSGPVVELKSWAYANQAGVIQTAGGGAFADAASFQMQAYEIMVDEQGIPVFVINERGNIYARDSSKGTWFRADRK